MASNTSTFAGQLRHFARSVDIVDDDTFDNVRKLMYRYVKKELEVTYFEVMRDQLIDDEPGLRMFWSTEDRDHAWRLTQPDGSPTNLVTRAFAEQRPLWVVAPDRAPLREAEKLEDLWSNCTDLGAYHPSADQPIKTLMVLPLRRRRRLGVCYLESSAHWGITDVAKAELQLLGEAVAMFLELYEANRTQTQNTAAAIDELQDSLEASKFPKLTKPHLFLAYSSRAEPDVTAVIFDVLKELTDSLDYTDWPKINETGNVNVQIAQEITRATFGICYFSEPGPDAGNYVDNPNVVFEAGMLHARTADRVLGVSREAGGWIPLREQASPPVPFDFAAERTIVVPRRTDGSLDGEELRSLVRGRIENLLTRA